MTSFARQTSMPFQIHGMPVIMLEVHEAACCERLRAVRQVLLQGKAECGHRK